MSNANTIWGHKRSKHIFNKWLQLIIDWLPTFQLFRDAPPTHIKCVLYQSLTGQLASNLAVIYLPIHIIRVRIGVPPLVAWFSRLSLGPAKNPSPEDTSGPEIQPYRLFKILASEIFGAKNVWLKQHKHLFRVDHIIGYTLYHGGSNSANLQHSNLVLANHDSKDPACSWYIWPCPTIGQQ